MLQVVPEVVFLFVMFFAPPNGGRPVHEIVYITTDKEACEAQAKSWTTALAPLKYVCLPHRQKKLKYPNTSDSQDE
jgi:hypothetical protein